MKNFFKNVTDVIEKINTSIDNLNKCPNYEACKKDAEVYETMEFELAKAFILDWEDVAVRVAKMILAHKDISDIKVKVE